MSPVPEPARRSASALPSAPPRVAPVITYPAELPITERRADLLAAIGDHQVVIVAGETGSGKSTQLPKLCLELGRGVAGLIGHTQPRRVAARAIAERVAEELGTDLGTMVGYTVRFTDRVGADTMVKVMTDGILLAELARDRDLSRYDTLIIDEAHERSLNIDFILGYLKQLLARRADLKVIVTSATIDTARFAAHFDDAPVIEVSGRMFPVEVRYRPFGTQVTAEEGEDAIDDDRDQIEAVGDAVDELIRHGPGDVLVFLSGEREIRDTADALAECNRAGTEVLPLYGRLSAAEQHRVFQTHSDRRIVLATNVAETSLTVPGVRYVVDAGTARVSRYSHRLRVQRLPIEKVSQASADQRAGRCGRVGPGVCIRLYSEEDFEERPRFTDPEVLRTNLASVILTMTNLGLGDVAAFGFLDPPDPRSIRDGVALLEELGALDPDVPADRRRLTKVGRRLARLPLDPRLGRMVLAADAEGCVREVLVISAALAIQDPRERPTEERAAADEAHRRFDGAGSDLLALVELWDHLAEQRRNLSSNQFRKQCRAQFLNHLRVREWQDLHRQLQRAASSLRITASTSPASADQVHRALLAGLLSHIGMRDTEGREFRGARNARFALVYSSVLGRKPPGWVMAAELVETNRVWGRMAAAIQPAWAEELGAHLVKRSYGEPRWQQRSGRAEADERVTLYGLPVVTGRTVGYDRADPREARDLFIDHALVRREWSSPHRFLAANVEVLDQLEDLGARLRRVDLVSDDAVFDFYDRRVGDDVVSGRHFDQWWKQTQRDRPDLLDLSAGALLDDGHGDRYDPADHPDTWHQGELELAISYRFAPGEASDGATVQIPLALMNQVDPHGFDWQVPGYRGDLVAALVRTLPKARRRALQPLAETTERVIDRVRRRVSRSAALPPHDLTEVLAVELTDLGGEPVAPTDFDVRSVPAHLRMGFAAVDGDQVMANGRDLDAVRDLIGAQARAAIAEAAPAIERTGITTWDFGELPEVVRSHVGANPVEGFPALLDEGQSVAIRVFSRREVAERIMPAGIRRLALLTVPVGVKGLAREVPNPVRLALASFEDLTVGALLRDAITAGADVVIGRHGGAVRDRSGFDGLIANTRAELRSEVARALGGAGPVIVVGAEVSAVLEHLVAPDLETSVLDARAHLRRLVRPGFVAAAGTGRLADVARYVRGIEWRLVRVGADPGRDRARMAEVLAVEHDYEKLLAALRPSQMTLRVVEAGWMLEELRVSVFAETVGAKGRVSAKRITVELDRLFAGDLD